MADNSLTTTTNSGQQTTSQSPQPSVQSGTGRAQAGNLQPGTSTSLLNSQNGVKLQNNQVTTVSLATTNTPDRVAPQGRHFHPGLFVISLALLIIAVILFRSTQNGANSTTK